MLHYLLLLISMTPIACFIMLQMYYAFITDILKIKTNEKNVFFYIYLV